MENQAEDNLPAIPVDTAAAQAELNLTPTTVPIIAPAPVIPVPAIPPPVRATPLPVVTPASAPAVDSAVSNSRSKNPWAWLRQINTKIWLALGMLVVGIMLGAVLLWIPSHQAINSLTMQLNNALSENKKMLLQVDEGQIKLHNMVVGFGQVNRVFEVMDQKPVKPSFFETAAQGVVVYWLDGMLWRKYHLYQGKGRDGHLQKLNKRAMQKNFMYFPRMERGVYRFVITALDRLGKETEMSESLEIKVGH